MSERQMVATRRFAGVATLVALAATILTVVTAATGPAGTGLSAHGLLLSAFVYACVGALVVARQPANPFGWLLLTVGLLGTLGPLSEQVSIAVYAHDRALPGGLVAAWFAEWYWLPWNYAQFVFFPLLFPTGRPASSRWRRLGAAAMAVLMVSVVFGMFSQELHVDPTLEGRDSSQVLVVENPVGVLPTANLEAEGSAISLLILGIPLGGLCAIASLIGRYRRARGIERHQISWVVYGVVVTVSGMAIGSLLDALGVAAVKLVGESILLFVIPVTLGVALLSNRLWDIDHVVSRTVSYVVVTAVLGAVYVAGVLGVGSLVPGESSDLLVAGSTLAVAALFQPVRRRVQSFVDRRFNRARYDAQRTVTTFASTVRDEVDLSALIDGLVRVTDRAVQPAHASIWLAPSGS